MANNLAKIRKALALTQPELAERMGTTKNQLIKLEKGDRRLTQEWLEKAAQATGVAIEHFVTENLALDGLALAPAEPRLSDDLVAEFRRILPKLTEGRRKRLLDDLRDAARLEGLEGFAPASRETDEKTGE